MVTVSLCNLPYLAQSATQSADRQACRLQELGITQVLSIQSTAGMPATGTLTAFQPAVLQLYIQHLTMSLLTCTAPGIQTL